MRVFKSIKLLVLFMLLGTNVISQNVDIKSTVFDLDGAIPKAKVQVVNSKNKVFTNRYGVFEINAPQNAELIIIHKKSTAKIKVQNGKIKERIVLIPTEKKLYKKIEERQELRLCNVYIRKYQSGKNIEKVKQIKERLIFIQSYNIATTEYSDTALLNYLNKYPNGKYVSKAKDAIEIACWQKACYENTLEAYKQYLQKYPNGKASNLAKNKISTFK